MDFTPGQQLLLAYWGNIQSAVSQRASTQDLWSAVRDAAATEGVQLKGVSAIDMNLLRSIAAEQQRSMQTLASAPLSQAIDPSMIARDVSARDQAAQNLAPAWLVRFEHQVLVEGETVTQWRTSTFEGFLPATKADLLDQVGNDAIAMADDYGTTHVGVGAVQISAV